MGVRDAELEFEANDTYWLDELDAEIAWEFEYGDDSDWDVDDEDDDYYTEDDDYDDFTDWEIDLLDTNP